MLPLVTLCGSYNLKNDYVSRCINSWNNLQNVNKTQWHLIPDSNLAKLDELKFINFGFKIHNSQEIQNSIHEKLINFPALKKIRDEDLTWRKILDTTILFSNYEQIVLIDTDVLVNHPCTLPEIDSDFIYMLEDIPAYRGNWRVAWLEKMVPAFNAGLVIFRPSKVDFEYLEYLTKKYILQCKNYWWSEQLAWACLAGRTEKRYVFNGSQTRVVSGFLKRSPAEVVMNRYAYFGKKGTIEEFNEFKGYIEGSSILHFAGFGKRWFNPSYDFLNNNTFASSIKKVEVFQDDLLDLKDKICISTRLFLKELV